MASKIYFPKKTGGALKKDIKFDYVPRATELRVPRKARIVHDITPPPITELRSGEAPTQQEQIASKEELYEKYLEDPTKFSGYSLGALKELKKEAKEFEKSQKEVSQKGKEPKIRRTGNFAPVPGGGPVLIFKDQTGKWEEIPRPNDPRDIREQFAVDEILADRPEFLQGAFNNRKRDELFALATDVFNREFGNADTLRKGSIAGIRTTFKAQARGRGLKFVKGVVHPTKDWKTTSIDASKSDKVKAFNQGLHLSQMLKQKGKLSQAHSDRLTHLRALHAGGFFSNIVDAIKKNPIGAIKQAIDVGTKVHSVGKEIHSDYKQKQEDARRDRVNAHIKKTWDNAR